MFMPNWFLRFAREECSASSTPTLLSPAVSLSLYRQSRRRRCWGEEVSARKRNGKSGGINPLARIAAICKCRRFAGERVLLCAVQIASTHNSCSAHWRPELLAEVPDARRDFYLASPRLSRRNPLLGPIRCGDAPVTMHRIAGVALSE